MSTREHRKALLVEQSDRDYAQRVQEREKRRAETDSAKKKAGTGSEEVIDLETSAAKFIKLYFRFACEKMIFV